MINVYNNRNFLLALDKNPNKLIYVRVTALNLHEQPIQAVEGYVTTGTINVDGKSSVRRTCSLTLVANYDQFLQDDAQKFFNYNWGLHTRFKLEIGVENEIDNNYPNIIWFPQGIYITTSITVSYSVNNFQLTLQGKDKMCLLNGEVSGLLESSIDFGTENFMGKQVKIPIEKIILNAIHIYGKEPYHNIIINDLELFGLELLEYRGSSPLYLLTDPNDLNHSFINLTAQGEKSCFMSDDNNSQIQITLETLEKNGGQYNINNNILLDIPQKPTKVIFNKEKEEEYTITKIQYGNAAGYRKTELVYAGDLIANAGDSLTTILDKIIKMLGQFEYFYDLDGHFIFQKKPSETNDLWNRGLNVGSDNNIPIMPYQLSTNILYTFQNGELITSFSNTPDLSNVKNDFSVWGEKTATSGAIIPIHMRYAIDIKPTQYTSIKVEENNQQLENYNQQYNAELYGQYSITYKATVENYYINTNKAGYVNEVFCDWREIIYRMAADYYKYGHLSDFLERVAKANPQLYPTGNTGYEAYYIDLYSFWRDIYNPKENYVIDQSQIRYLMTQLPPEENQTEKDKLKMAQYQEKNQKIIDEKEQYEKEDKYYLIENTISEKLNGWSKIIINTPELLTFWFDFLDLDKEAELEKYSVRTIGQRLKVVNDENLQSIYYPTVPNIVYLEDIQDKDLAKENMPFFNCTFLQVFNQNDFFSISNQGISIQDKVNNLINTHNYYIENITISTIPIYYLEPNARIKVINETMGINGEYIINKINIPLSYNGTMQIVAEKAINNII